ncbi:hypothetical protein HF319_11155 [Xanthomonas sp. Kuri4-1]
MITSFLSVALLALCVYAIHGSRRKLSQALQHSFAQCRFDTPQGHVSGASLRVVKASHQVSRHTSGAPSEIFWYCVAPGPAYFLAIAHVTRPGRRIEVRWTLRALTEERMRGALVDDRKATAAAFGQDGAATAGGPPAGR